MKKTFLISRGKILHLNHHLPGERYGTVTILIMMNCTQIPALGINSRRPLLFAAHLLLQFNPLAAMVQETKVEIVPHRRLALRYAMRV
jgi:hypothetical protein